MQQIIVVVMAVAVGLVSGALGVHYARQAEVQELQAAVKAQEADADARVAEAEARAAERIRSLEAETEAAKAKLYERENELAAVEESASTAQERLLEAERRAMAAMESGEDEETAETEAPRDEDRRDRRGRGDWGNMTEEQREEMAARFREGMNQVFEEEMAYATDEESRARVAAISGYANQMFDVRRAMRDAATDEERDALRAEMDAMREETDKLVKEQQNAMLREVARAHGVKGGPETRAYMQDIRSVIESPFFTFPMGGRGGPPGGFGGRRGGGEAAQ
jgi:hypothetical protein